MTLRTYIALILFILACFLMAITGNPTVSSWSVVTGLGAVALGMVLLTTRGLRSR